MIEQLHEHTICDMDGNAYASSPASQFELMEKINELVDEVNRLKEKFGEDSMLTDKQIEREEAFCEDWYMTRKMGKTPTYADAIAWADKTMIDKACEWLYVYYPTLERSKSAEDAWDKFKKAMEE